MAGAQPRVFISYARSDDEPFVERLHYNLEAAGINVWWDRDTMASRGRTFLQEIRDAIEAVDRVIAVIGPQAIRSDYVRSEWEHAALFAKGLLPILRLGHYNLVPSELLPENDQGLAASDLAKLHCPDFRVERPYEQALNELVAIIRQPVPPLASYDGTPALPPHFLPRPDDLRRLKKTVLEDIMRPTVITSVKQTAALQGMGGIGKSVLAAAFARAVSTRRAMEDGILWLKAGQDATRLTLLANMQMVGSALGDATENYLDEVAARQQLPKVLADKVCLIVLDDVWSIEQVEPFRDVLGPRCRLLLTTRDGSLTTTLGAQEHHVDVLSTDQALTLLAEWSEQSRETIEAEARQVARQCGYLPLALALCGAMARDGTPWPDLLGALRETDLTFIEARLPNYAFPNVLRALRVSVEMLGREDRTTVEQYHELVVFPREAVVSEAAVLVLWCRGKGLSERAARKLLTILARKSLLMLEGDSPHRRVSFHDLQYDYLQAVAGDRIATLHSVLINAYQSTCPKGWATGPNDGYFFHYLPRHLAQAGQSDEVRTLLLDYPWLAAKLQATDVQALIADCDLLPMDAEIRLLQGAIRLSIPALTRDSNQLAAHLMGRLLPFEEKGLRQLREGASARLTGGRWLCPKGASLLPPGGSMILTLAGHTSGVRGAAVSADGSRALSWSGGFWSNDRTLRLWDLGSGRLLHTFEGHTSDIKGAAVSTDGRRALSWSDDGTLRLWDLASGRLLHTLEGHTEKVSGATVLADSARALSWSDDGTLRLWDLTSGRLLHSLEGHMEKALGATVLPDGARALSWSDDGTLRLWDLTSGRTLHTLKGNWTLHKGNAGRSATGLDWLLLAWLLRALARPKVLTRGAAVLADGSRALSWSNDGTLRLWDLTSGRLLHTLEEHTGPVLGASVSADGSRALSWSNDGALWLWDLGSGRLLHTLEEHTDWDWIRGAAVSADSSRALSWSNDGTLRLWDLASGRLLHTLKGHRGSVRGAALLADGARALSWSSDRRLQLWDLGSGRLLHTLEGHTDPVRYALVLADGARALSWSDDGTLRLWDLTSAWRLHSLEGHTGSVRDALVLPDGARALSWSSDGTLRLWDLTSGRLLHTLEGHTGSVRDALVLADGSRVLSWSDDGTLRLWDLTSGRLLHTLEGHTEKVSGAVVLAGSGRALSWSLDDTLRLWDLGSGQMLHTLKAIISLHTLKGNTGQSATGMAWLLLAWLLLALVRPKALTRGAAVLADGNRALSWSDDGTLRLWDLGSGRLLHTLEGHKENVSGATVLADGNRALSWSDDGTLRLWDLGSGRLLHSLEGHTKNVLGATVLADGGRALSWSKDGTLRLWDLASGRLLHILDGHTGPLWRRPLVLADDARALSWSEDWSLILWDLQAGRAIARFIGEAEITTAVAASDDLFIAGATNGAVHILELRGE